MNVFLNKYYHRSSQLLSKTKACPNHGVTMTQYFKNTSIKIALLFSWLCVSMAMAQGTADSIEIDDKWYEIIRDTVEYQQYIESIQLLEKNIAVPLNLYSNFYNKNGEDAWCSGETEPAACKAIYTERSQYKVYYLIESEKDFKLFVDIINTRVVEFEFNAFLTSDLDFAFYNKGDEKCEYDGADTLKPIYQHFGDFDGGNHIIQGLCYKNPDMNGDYLAALFVSKEGGNIRNLRIKNSYFESYSATAANAAAALVGSGGANFDKISIDSVTVKAGEGGSAGALIGNLVGNDQYIVDISISNSHIAGTNAGGFAGTISSTGDSIVDISISNSYIAGTNAGGFAGTISSTSGSISKVILKDLRIEGLMSASIEGLMSASNIAGFVGRVEKSNLVNFESLYLYNLNLYSEGVLLEGEDGIEKKHFVNVSEDANATISASYVITDSLAVSASENSLSLYQVFISQSSGKIESAFHNNEPVDVSWNAKSLAAAHFLNGETWTQNASVNSGFPYFRVNEKPIYKITLLKKEGDDSLDLYTSPQNGFIVSTESFSESDWPAIPKKIPEKGPYYEGYHEGYLPEDDFLTNKILTLYSKFTEDASFMLYDDFKNRNPISYNIGGDFVFWLDDSLGSFNKDLKSMEYPKIAKEGSCFKGWTRPDMPSDTGFFTEQLPKNFLTLEAIWGELEDCEGNGVSIDYSVLLTLETKHAYIEIKNNGNVVPLNAKTLPVLAKESYQRIIPIPIPFTFSVHPRDSKMEREATFLKYGDAQEVLENNLPIEFVTQNDWGVNLKSDTFSISAIYTGENIVDSIYYNKKSLKSEDVSQPILLLGEPALVQEYSPLKPTELQKLVQIGQEFQGWEVKCMGVKGLNGCIYNGELIQVDSILKTSIYDLSGIEGDIELSPKFNPILTSPIKVELKSPHSGGTLALIDAVHQYTGDTLANVFSYPAPDNASNTGGASMSGRAPLRLNAPVETELFQYSADSVYFKVLPLPDSGYTMHSLLLTFEDGSTENIDWRKWLSFSSNVTILPSFTALDILLSGFQTKLEQEGGALWYRAKLDSLLASTVDSLELSLLQKNTLVFDTVFTDIKPDQWLDFKQLNLPLGEAELRSRIHIQGRSKDTLQTLFVDTSFALKAEAWHLKSFANLNPNYHKPREDYLFAWLDSIQMSDFLQYQELFSIQNLNENQGYWYWSDLDQSFPLELSKEKSEANFTDSSEIAWKLKAGNTGWNLIANPYHWTIALPDTPFVFWKWVDSIGSYEPTQNLKAQEAVWVHIQKNTTIKTKPQALFSTTIKDSSSIAFKKKALAKAPNAKDFMLQLKLKQGDTKQDIYNFVGVSSQAFKLEKPPTGMGNFIRLAILNGPKDLAQNIVLASDSIYQWDLLLSSGDNGKVELLVEGIERLLSMGYKAALFTPNKAIELTSSQPVSIPLEFRQAKVSLVVSLDKEIHMQRGVVALRHFKQGSQCGVEFMAGYNMVGSKALVSIFSLKGELLTQKSLSISNGKNLLKTTIPKNQPVFIQSIIYDQNSNRIAQKQDRLY